MRMNRESLRAALLEASPLVEGQEGACAGQKTSFRSFKRAFVQLEVCVKVAERKCRKVCWGSKVISRGRSSTLYSSAAGRQRQLEPFMTKRTFANV